MMLYYRFSKKLKPDEYAVMIDSLIHKYTSEQLEHIEMYTEDKSKEKAKLFIRIARSIDIILSNGEPMIEDSDKIIGNTLQIMYDLDFGIRDYDKRGFYYGKYCEMRNEAMRYHSDGLSLPAYIGLRPKSDEADKDYIQFKDTKND